MRVVILCYLFWTITVASCVETGNKTTNELQTDEENHSVSKREATLIIDHLPYERLFLKNSKLMHKRISQNPRYIPPKSHYRSSKPRYKSHKPLSFNRKPGKKYRDYSKPKHTNPKYYPSAHKHNRNKHKYGPPSKSRPNGYGHVIKINRYTSPSESTGFGEPPTNYGHEYQAPKQSYGEPPTDSYGAPLKLNIDGSIHPSAPQSFQEPNNHFEELNYHKQAYPPWAPNRDTSFAFSKQKPTYTKPEPEDVIVTRAPVAIDYSDDFDEIFQPNQVPIKKQKYPKKKRPHYFTDTTKSVSRPWIAKKPEGEPEIIVGGQYAEPPPRLAARFQPSVPMFEEDDEFSPVQQGFNHRNKPSNSPYVNYKNSNLAFSPQNLNDAFSIVDK